MTSPPSCSAMRRSSRGSDENLIKASSGKQALEELLRTDIAVVLMDVSMPELDGFELAEIIHQHPRFQHVRSFLSRQFTFRTSIALKATTVALLTMCRSRLSPKS